MSSLPSDYVNREQSGIKHFALRLYLEAATRILGASRNLKFVDCCAGPWDSQQPDYSDTSFGIAVDVLTKAAAELALRNLSPRLACLLIEKENEPFQKLREFAEAHDSPALRVSARQTDFTVRTAEIARYCSTANTFPFVLIDPWGWKLAGISQILPLLKLNPGEVLINLMSPFIARFMKDNKTDFSDLLGKDFPELRKLQGDDLELAIVRKYCEVIKREGDYKYVCALPVMNPDLDSFNFHLIYATRHWKGVQVFKAVEKRTEEMTHVVRAEVQQRIREQRSGNRELFSADVQYREARYQRLASENRESTKAQVWQMIVESGTIVYDECWAEALQISAVYELDLRAWLKEWEADGLIEVLGRKNPREVLKIQAGHLLRIIARQNNI